MYRRYYLIFQGRINNIAYTITLYIYTETLWLKVNLPVE